MKRKIVQTGSSLAVTLPKDIVDEFKLKKGDEVDVSVHPQTGVIMMRTGIRYFDDGKVTKRFKEISASVIKRHAKAFEALSK
jgi:antitoxin component of MazEF toxin-antitoxin module